MEWWSTAITTLQHSTSSTLPCHQRLARSWPGSGHPTGCPWDREQDHMALRWHAVEEVYELLDAIEAGDDHEMEEELGDLLLQVVFHCQLARERGAFDFEKVARHITDKLIRRHPHVFGNAPRQGRGPGLGELGKDQAGRKARDPARAAFGPGRHPETSARAAARREAA